MLSDTFAGRELRAFGPRARRRSSTWEANLPHATRTDFPLKDDVHLHLPSHSLMARHRSVRFVQQIQTA